MTQSQINLFSPHPMFSGPNFWWHTTNFPTGKTICNTAIPGGDWNHLRLGLSWRFVAPLRSGALCLLHFGQLRGLGRAAGPGVPRVDEIPNFFVRLIHSQLTVPLNHHFSSPPYSPPIHQEITIHINSPWHPMITLSYATVPNFSPCLLGRMLHFSSQTHHFRCFNQGNPTFLLLKFG